MVEDEVANFFLEVIAIFLIGSSYYIAIQSDFIGVCGFFVGFICLLITKIGNKENGRKTKT